MSKLTLSLDEKTIEVGKAYARAHRTSLSKVIASYLRSLSPIQGDPVIEKLHRQMEARGYKPPRVSDDELRRRHLKKKYGG